MTRRNDVPTRASQAHPGPPTVEYAAIVDPDCATIEVSFGNRLALVFTIWGDGETVTVRTIEESHVSLTAFREAFARYSDEAEAWAKSLCEASVSSNEQDGDEFPTLAP